MDIKAIKKNEEDLKKFKLAVEGASDHIVITDQDGIILYANQSVEKITGFSSKEIIGKKAGSKQLWGGLMPPEVYEKLWKIIKIRKKPYKGEIKNRRKNGEIYDAEATVSPILNDKKEVVFFVGIERDITKIREVDRMKTEFVSLASHQLRTPLSAIKWSCEILLKGDAGRINKEQKDLIWQINESNKRMIELVGTLLNISKIESGKISIEPKKINVGFIVEEILDELSPKIKLKKQKIIKRITRGLKPIMIDPKMIKEVYANILFNASKYTPKGGKITITISKKENEIISKISDTGYGIPLNDQSRIFSKFFRASNVIKVETDGNGLGMYLVKTIVESSGGKIWFESKEKKGTTFFFTLPLNGIPKNKKHL